MTLSVVSTLGFYDHHRQTYAHLPLDNAEAEFMVGGYGEDGKGGVDELGEFKILLYSFRDDKSWSVQVCVFDDAYGAFRACQDAGLLEAIKDAEIRSRDDMTQLLLGLGLRDLSHHPRGWRLKKCPCCGKEA